MPNHPSPRILISRLSAIGDAILTLPVACALRDAYPNAYIAWVVEKKAASMVRGHAAIDAVIELQRGWFSSPRGIVAARRQLRALQIETALDCQGNTKSALACWLSGARRRIGYAGWHGGELSRLLNNLLIPVEKPHLTDRSLGLLHPLGIDEPAVRWDLPLPAAARTWATSWRSTLADRRIAVINPGGSWNSKLWEMDRFAEVASYLYDVYQMRSVVVWGGAVEQQMAVEICEASGGAAIQAPETDLPHLAALIGTADLYISGDTGPLHMAVAVGTPAIGLYGTTRPADSGPYGAPHIALQRAYHDGSRRTRRGADNTAVRQITVADVCQAADRLQRRSATRAA